MKGLLEVKQKFLNNQETYYCLPAQYKPPNYIHFTRSNYAKVFSEKGVLKNSQNSQENTFVGVFFLIKFQVSGLQRY